MCVLVSTERLNRLKSETKTSGEVCEDESDGRSALARARQVTIGVVTRCNPAKFKGLICSDAGQVAKGACESMFLSTHGRDLTGTSSEDNLASVRA
jgi:hypothetical protein